MANITEFKLNPLDGSTTTEYSDGVVKSGSIVAAANLTDADTSRVRGQSAASNRILQPTTTAFPGAPSVTIGHTTTNIASGVTVTKDNLAFEYLGVGIAAWAAIPTMNISNPAAGYMSVEFQINTAGFDVILNNQNTRVMVWIDDKPAMSNHLQLSASGVAEFMNVDFGGVRQNVRVRIDGYNMPFGGIVMGTSDTVWSSPSALPIMVVGPGDSYTQGTGSRAQSLNWAATFARALGYRFWLDGIGSTGWNTASPNSPAERVQSKGANALIKRVSGVNTSVTPEKVIVALGYNDAAGNMTTASAAFDSYYAACVKKPDIVVGPWTPLGSTTNLTLVKNMLQNRATAYNIPFLDIDNQINSTNKAVLTDADNIHPSYAGHDFLGLRCSQLAVAAGYITSLV